MSVQGWVEYVVGVRTTGKGLYYLVYDSKEDMYTLTEDRGTASRFFTVRKAAGHYFSFIRKKLDKHTILSQWIPNRMVISRDTICRKT